MRITDLYDKSLTSGLYEIDTSDRYFKEWRGYCMDVPHTHPSCEIMAVIKGQCHIVVNGRQMKFAKNSVILINGSVPHRLVVSPGQHCLMLNVEFNFVPAAHERFAVRSLADNVMSFRELLNAGRDYVKLEGAYDLVSLIRILVIELHNRSADKSLAQHLYFVILELIARNALDCGGDASADYVRQISKYLGEYYAYNITVSDIADYVNLNSAYMQRLYKRKTGATIIERLTNIRIERAKEILADKSIPISEISGYVGINTNQYFSALFRKKTGMTPSQWRNADY